MFTIDARFYEELNEYLPREKRKREFRTTVEIGSTVARFLQAWQVPRSAVDLILVNGVSVGFDHPLKDGDRVSVYPVFESFDIRSQVRARTSPLRAPRFVAEPELRDLAALLHARGFDVRCESRPRSELIRLSEDTRSILLTRDESMLARDDVTRACCLRQSDPTLQLRELTARLHLDRAAEPE